MSGDAIPTWRTGDPLLAAKLQSMCDEIARNRVLGITGAKWERGPQGWSMAIDTAAPAAVPARVRHPFEVVAASSTDVARVRIYSGVAAGLNPVASGPFAAGDSPAFILPVADGHQVYVQLTVSYSSTTGLWSCTSYTVSAGALPAATSTRAYYPIGTVTVEDKRVTNIGGGVLGNIGWRRCGDTTAYTDEWWAGP